MRLRIASVAIPQPAGYFCVRANGVCHFTGAQIPKQVVLSHSKRTLHGKAHFLGTNVNSRDGFARPCVGYNCHDFSWHLHAIGGNPEDLRRRPLLRRKDLYRFTPAFLLTTDHSASADFVSKPYRGFVAALTASALDGSDWVSLECSLRDALIAVTTVNTATAVGAAVHCESRPASEQLNSQLEGSQQMPNVLEQLVAAAWGLPKAPVSFMLLERSPGSSNGAHPRVHVKSASRPLLLPLVVSPEDTAVYSQHHHHAPQGGAGSEFWPVALVLLRDSPNGSGCEVRELRVPPQELMSIVGNTENRTQDVGEQLLIAETLALLYGVVAADVVAGRVKLVDRTPQTPQSPTSRQRGSRTLKPVKLEELRALLTFMLQLAVDRILLLEQWLPPSTLLQAVSALAYLGSSRPSGFLSSSHLEQHLLKLLRAAEPLFLEHQRSLDLAFSDETNDSSRGVEATTTQGLTDSEGREATGGQWEEERRCIQLPLQDAVFTLGLLGWLQRHGPANARPSCAQLLAPLADFVGRPTFSTTHALVRSLKTLKLPIAVRVDTWRKGLWYRV